ncbi:FecR family protein [Niabella pedocola]|uniref:FecR family protein n=1 Tax=Niabella pedocola TaxID=1752077 RepID=A0ABS8PVV5_9BACT|nr:FecR family protein [Niabella pedocola]MCD2425212.1 FecR family protein [Niabella pedocola]
MTETIHILLAKYISGVADASEKLQAEQWIAASPDNAAYYAKIYDLWHLTRAAVPGDFADSKAAYEQFLIRNHLKAERPVLRLRSFKKKRIYWAAAALLILSLTGYRWFFSGNRKMGNTMVASARELSKQVLLPDSTVVWINAGSKIRWNKDFGKTNRTVYLDGEGNFTINNRQSAIPFIVKAARFEIRDIGTVFNIKAFASDSLFEAFVVDGKIAITDANDARKGAPVVYLTRNQILKINHIALQKQRGSSENMVAVSNADIQEMKDVNEHLQWKETALAFEEKGLPEILRLLSEKYNIDILFQADELARYRYTGRFNSQMNIETILDVIKETTPINYEKKGETIIVKMSKPVDGATSPGF